MQKEELKRIIVDRILPRVQSPAQYMGGELNSIAKDHRSVRGTLCLAFPDTYAIGMSHHGLEVLYGLMNRREDWACERAFTPWLDFEKELREHDLPLYGWETFTPLCEFDVLGFTLQYEIGYTNILTMLDLGRIPLHSIDRGLEAPLIIAGGPCAQNPEPLADFIDVFVTGDGEPSLPRICDLWLELRDKYRAQSTNGSSAASTALRERALEELASRLPFAYVPRFYDPEYVEGKYAALNRKTSAVPETIEPSVIADLDGTPLPTHPIVPWTQTVHDRIAIEIMRGCPWQCRFCQSTVIKRPLRFRKVETIVNAALEAYYNSGFNEISILSLSTSDYPHFEELVLALKEKFNPLNVNIAVPSLRVNEQLAFNRRADRQQAIDRVVVDIGARKWLEMTCASRFARRSRTRICTKDAVRRFVATSFESGQTLFYVRAYRASAKWISTASSRWPKPSLELARKNAGDFAQASRQAFQILFPKRTRPTSGMAMRSPQILRMGTIDYLLKQVQRRLRSINVKCHDIDTSLLEGSAQSR